MVAAFAGASWAAWLVQQMKDVPWEYRFYGTMVLFVSLLLPIDVIKAVATTLAEGVASGLRRRIGGGDK